MSEEQLENTHDDVAPEIDAAQDAPAQELIFGKYKDMDAAQAAFKELESQIGKYKRMPKPASAPEEYNIDFSADTDLAEIADSINISGDPLMETMLPVFKELNLTNEQASALVKAKVLFDKSILDETSKAMAELGDEGKKMISAIDSVMAKTLSEDDVAALSASVTDPAAVRALYNLLNRPDSVPVEAKEAKASTVQELYAKAMEIRRTPGFDMNMEKRQQYEEIMKRAIAMEG